MKVARISLLGLILMAPSPLLAQSDDRLETYRHFRIEKPAQLTPSEAAQAYDQVSKRMFKGYAASKDPTAMTYTAWRRYNSFPYNSVTHGNRYLNNYANAKAEGYGAISAGEKMPAGAIIAKDSFTVTKDRAMYAGALFIMEKLAPGKSPETGDWRYQMIMPDGSLFGDTQGTGAKQVGFCHGCHVTEAKMDFLFFIPENFRR